MRSPRNHLLWVVALKLRREGAYTGITSLLLFLKYVLKALSEN